MRMKISLSLSLWIGLLSHQLYATEKHKTDDEREVAVIMFTDEFEEFVDHASELAQTSTLIPAATLEKEIQKLIHNANRIAAAYFETLDTKLQPEMEAYLHSQYISNPEIHHYFTLLGTAIFERANKLVEDQRTYHRQIRMWSTVGGSILGLASGGAILYFKPNLIPNPLHATLFVVGLGAAGGGVGYAGGYVTHSFILPANPDLLTAKDFLTKYPSGQSFVDDWTDASSDIAIGMLQLEEGLAHVGLD